MYLLLAVTVLIAVVYWFTNNTNSNVYKNPIEGSFDTSCFITSNGKFKFPYYETRDDVLVHIKDESNYDEFCIDLMDNGVIQDRQIDKLSLDVFNMYIGNYIEFVMDDFWEFMERLTEDDLQPYTFLKYHIDELKEILYDLEDEDSEHIFFLKDNFMNELHDRGLLHKCDDFDGDELYEVYLKSLNWDEIKIFADKYNIDSTINIFEIINLLVDKISNDDIPVAVVVNDKFAEMLQYFYVKYFAIVQDEINDWHPFYIEKVWECVGYMLEDLELDGFETIYDKVIETEYWKSRIQLKRL